MPAALWPHLARLSNEVNENNSGPRLSRRSPRFSGLQPPPRAFLPSSQQHFPLSPRWSWTRLHSHSLLPACPALHTAALADPSLLASCVLLKPLRLTSGLFLPPHNFQKPLCSTLFVKGYFGWFVCVYVCVQHSKTLSIVLFLCKVTLSSFWCVCVCVCVQG